MVKISCYSELFLVEKQKAHKNALIVQKGQIFDWLEAYRHPAGQQRQVKSRVNPGNEATATAQ